MTLCIIPARGGSKRLPRKNVIDVGGRPIISYPIAAALGSQLFGQVVVSSDDDETLEIATKFGAKAAKRGLHLATDFTSVVEVCKNYLLTQERFGVLPEYFCCIYPTACFLDKDDLLKSFEILSQSEADFVMGVSEYNFHPVQALVENGEYLQSMWPEFLKKQSQNYPQLFVSNGTIYWASTEVFLKQGTFYGQKLKPYICHHIDLDTPQDYDRIKEQFKLTLGS